MGWCGGGRDDPAVVYRRYAWNCGLPFGSGAVCGGRGQLAESVFPLSLIQAAGRPFHSREGPPFGLTGLSETSNVTRPRLVEERTFRARVLTSPNDPNRHCPTARAVDASAVQAQADSRHHLAVQVPSGVPEHGYDDDETKECGY